jgi:hypothetical protein
MAFEIYIKDHIINDIQRLIDNNIDKKITVANYTITDGLLILGSYRVPLSSILFIKEV